MNTINDNCKIKTFSFVHQTTHYDIVFGYILSVIVEDVK